MERLDLLQAPLSGASLIEASAGTGKTHTITGLYLRLVLESRLPVDRILVVTYTKAATAELRERLRHKLVAVRGAFEAGVGDDGFLQGLLERLPDPDQALRLLNRAILDFDRAAIFTIHGFCQRVLAESAFESVRPFQVELVGDQSDLIQEVVDDYWRLEIQDASRGFADYLLSRGVNPDSLAQQLRGWLGKPYVKVVGGDKGGECQALEDEFQRIFKEVSATWRAERQAITERLRKATGLNGNKYRKGSMESWFLQMDAYLGEGPGPWFDNFHRFSSQTLEESLKKGGKAPEHPFFGLCDRLLEVRERLNEQYEQQRLGLLRGLIDYANEALPERKRQSGIQSYDDLLLNLDQALDSERGPALIALLRERYTAALIDEFQDTDPVQYRIFRRIYGDSSLPIYFVGDPKQAIYSFRGADIFAYLKARDDADNQFTLDVNWRSAPLLLQGFNALFDQPHGSFFFPQIDYPPALPAPLDEVRRPTLKERGEASEPLRIPFLAGDLTKEQAGRLAVAYTAGEIRRLLDGGSRGAITLGSRPLAARDIAVLVRSHYQGSQIRQALLELGVHSVVRSQEDVFLSHEALELERVLKAIAEPGREPVVRAALVTDLFGLSGNDIDALSRDEDALEGHLACFRRYHQVWREQGFITMFRLLLQEHNLPARLRGLSNGERRITNLLHLGELLHREDREQRPSMEGLVKSLSQKRTAGRREDEAYQLRLESDEELVQIVTIHKSKGLQYPVVFCPFAWNGGLRSGKGADPYSFHDPEEGYRSVLELGSERYGQDRIHAMREEMAEGLRLLYVALTRAEQRCYLLWGKVKGAGESPLAWLLHPPAEPEALNALEALRDEFKGLSECDLINRVNALAEAAPGAIKVEPLDVEPSFGQPELTDPGAEQPRVQFSHRHFERQLESHVRVTSFSALASHGGNAELPDHDAHKGAGSDQATDRPVRDIFHFPKGARPGSCLHAIFEEIDFTCGEPALWEQKVAEKLDAFGFDLEWAGAVTEMIDKVLAAELAPGVSLSRVTDNKRLVELEFFYPLAELRAEGLSRLLLAHGMGGQGPIRRAIGQLGFSRVRGYMKGFVDLIFEADGRFYIVDYKSNWLGNRIDDYGQAQLTQAIARESYYLQYLLYTLALHRFLGQRLADYDYDRHMGGVFYLFLRGIDPRQPGNHGIYADRPSRALIEALDDYFSADEGRAA